MGEDRKVYKVLLGKPEGKRPLGRPKCGRENSIRWILGRLVSGAWNGFSWLRIGIMNTLMNHRVLVTWR
jgi:hypothetical protein